LHWLFYQSFTVEQSERDRYGEIIVMQSRGKKGNEKVTTNRKKGPGDRGLVSKGRIGLAGGNEGSLRLLDLIPAIIIITMLGGVRGLPRGETKREQIFLCNKNIYSSQQTKFETSP